MSAFEEDLPNQGPLLRAVLERYGPADPGLGRLRDLAADAPAIVLTGMGSSLSAALPAADRLAHVGRAAALEAGELLHYGLGSIAAGSLVVLVSQSGRSAETLEVARRLRETGASGGTTVGAAGRTRLVAVTNDESSPLAALADLVLPMLAGVEMTVATRTFTTSYAVLQAIADALGAPDPFVSAALAADLPAFVEAAARDLGPARRAAAHLAACSSLVIVSRGPGLAAADYGALITKETAAVHAEAMPGGSFRHGPLELAGPATGLIVLAPAGRTEELLVRLARDASRLGSPTWLIGMREDGGRHETDAPLVTPERELPEPLAPLVMSVRLQAFAAALASARGREPGVLTRSAKVTDAE